jgi:hypothetical protein
MNELRLVFLFFAIPEVKEVQCLLTLERAETRKNSHKLIHLILKLLELAETKISGVNKVFNTWFFCLI